MKIYNLFIVIILVVFSCNTGQNNSTDSLDNESLGIDSIAKGAIVYVELEDALEPALIKEGQSIFNAQCSQCHYLDTTTLHGPGWAGISNRRDPNWIMNMILNVDRMNQVDSVAHVLLENSSMQMPDQGLPVEKARAVLEFMRKNDIEQVGKKDEGVEK